MPLFAAGLLKVPGAAHGLSARLRSLLDGLIIATSLLLISWVLVLDLAVHAGASSMVDQVIGLAYPIGDVVVATLVLYVALRSRVAARRPPIPVTILGLALVALSVADSGYYYLNTASHYQSGDPIDAGWLCGFLLLLVASRSAPRMQAAQADEFHRSIGELLPYGAVVVATLISAVDILHHHSRDGVLVILRTVVMLTVVGRQVLTMAENRRLTQRLEQRVAERTEELRASEQRFEALVKHSSDAVSLVDLDGRIRYQSESALAVLGHSAESLSGRPFTDLVEETSRSALLETFHQVLRHPYQTAVAEIEIRHANGHRRLVETTVTNLVGEPSVCGLVLNSRDISDRKKLEDELLHQAFHDSLTGLANRALFKNRVEHALGRIGPDGASIAVLFLDLDGFKEINDSLGHASGDDLLVQLADRLRGCVRSSDTVARFGGDEFAVLIDTDGDGATADALAARILELLSAPFALGHREMTIGASVGIAVADPSITEAGQLLRNADLAMYRAKSSGGGRHVGYDPEMHRNLIERLELESDLRRAVRSGQLEVHYQPMLAIRSEEVVGFEALLRWPHPERGYVPPPVFIGLAEQTELIHEIGSFVLRTASAQLAEWQARPGVPPGLTMNVNISGRELQRDDFPASVAAVIAETGIAAESLVLEITESVLLEDTEGALATLQGLKGLGIRLAIDDFGTGYSSLSYLHQFPIDVLKIDKSFIDRLGAADQEEVVGTIIQLGSNLRMTTIAEGIEDHAQALTLRRLGCELAQGFHYARPAPADQIERLFVDSARPEMPAAS